MSEVAGNHSGLMDSVYRKQRHIYDLTRKYYLLGRDHLIAHLAVPDGGTVLEVACGTGRNLTLVAQRYPDAQLFGFDISAEMLKSAEAAVERKALFDQVSLAQADATDFDPQALFGRRHFDRILISYSLSMIPVWRAAIGHAATTLAPGGELHVVDFGQQTRLPGWFRNGLHGWLAKFHVEPRAELEEVMADTATAIGGTLGFTPLYRDYARYGVISAPTD